jgi:hypothetical protein
VQPALVAVVHTRVWGAIVGRRPYCAGVQLLQQCAMAVGSRCVCCGAVLLVSWYYVRLPQPGAAAVAGTAMCAVLVQGYVAVPLQQLDGGLCAPEQFVHLTCVLHWRHAVC